MLVAARDAGVRRFVYAASSSTYGDHPGLPKVEDAIGRPLSPYAVTKLVNELYADVFARCYGMQSIGLRYFNIFGARQDPDGAYAAVIPRWIRAMLVGEEVVINGDGETSRDFCYVDNAVQANLLAALTDDPAAINQVYNVAVDDRTSLNRLFALLRDAIATQIPEVAAVAAVHRDFRPGDVRHSQADIGKARRLLGYAPTHRLARRHPRGHAMVSGALRRRCRRASSRWPPARHDGPRSLVAERIAASAGASAGAMRARPVAALRSGAARPRATTTATRAGCVATLRAEARAYRARRGRAPAIRRAPSPLYCEAARLGDAEAQFGLGWMYANGRGVPRDNRMASLFFGIAAAQGHEYAQRMLAFVGTVGRGPARLHARTRRCAEPSSADVTDAVEGDDDFVAVDARAEEGGRDRAQARARIPVSPQFALAIIRAESNFDPERALDQERAGPDAARPRDIGAVQRQEAVRSGRRTFAAGSPICAGCSRISGATSRWSPPRTMPAKARWSAIGGIPPYAETRAYVQRIKRYFRRDSHPYDATVTDPSPELSRIARRDDALELRHAAAVGPSARRRLRRRWRHCSCSSRGRSRGAGGPARRGRAREAVRRRRRNVSEDLRSPPFIFRGTGFAVGDGTLVATNAHVVAGGAE